MLLKLARSRFHFFNLVFFSFPLAVYSMATARITSSATGSCLSSMSLRLSALPLQHRKVLGLLVVLACCLRTAVAKTPPKQPCHLTFFLHNKVLNLTEGVNNTNDFNSVFSVHPTGVPGRWSFGVLATFEDPLTKHSSNTSAPMGIAQGFYMYDSQASYVLFEAFTATINTTEYQGSLQIFGQIKETLPKRVLSVIGGTGDFFLARGIATCELTHLYYGPGAAWWTLHFELDLYY